MKTLYRIARSKQIDNKFYVFDVETQGLSARPESFIFGCIYGHEYRKVFYSLEEFNEILMDFRFNNSIIFAHNAEFDLTVMFGHIIKNLDRNAIFNGKFICAKRDKVKFADSFNIFPTSVKKIGEQIGLHKLELDEGFKTGTKKEITHTDIEYCIRDCEIVWKALKEIFTICGAVKITIASLALAYYRNTFMPPAIKSDDKLIYEFFRSYYGGRVEAFVLGKVGAYKYDVNSMYPFAMKECIFPNPNKLKTIPSPNKERLEHELKYNEGLATITVEHKDLPIGFLPFRKDDKLIFPVGIFTGTWNFLEIRFALKHKVIKILKVHEIISAPPYISPFISFVDDVYAKRKSSKGIYNTIYKLILNSLYGKFAQKINFDQTYYDEIPYAIARDLQDRKVDFNIQLFNSTRKDCFLQIKKVGYLHHTIPVFSSYITSFSRCRLLEYLYDNMDFLVYCDTDSVCLECEREYNSEKLGELKREKSIIIEIYGNKSYSESDGYFTKLKMKGVPEKAERVSIKEYNYLKMTKTKEGLRRNIEPGHFRTINKKLTLKYDKREVFPDGTTKPIKLS